MQIRGMRKLLLLATLLGVFTTVLVRADTPDPSRIPYTSLTPEEREILARGEISTTAYVAGGVVGTFVGLGIGNAIQGRYMPYGLVFTLGEIGSASLYAWGVADCLEQDLNGVITRSTVHCHDGALVVGAIGLVGFRVWEIIDNWAAPPLHNDRYRDLKRRVDGAPSAHVEWLILPAIAEERKLDGAALGMQIKF